MDDRAVEPEAVVLAQLIVESGPNPPSMLLLLSHLHLSSSSIVVMLFKSAQLHFCDNFRGASSLYSEAGVR